MNTNLSIDLGIEEGDSTKYEVGQYWCVVKRAGGQLTGTVGSSGKGNQLTKSIAFSIFRPVSDDDLIAVYSEWLTNVKLYYTHSKRTYRFVLTVLKALLSNYTQRIWPIVYRNRSTSLLLTDNRMVTIKIDGQRPTSMALEHWNPAILEHRLFPYAKLKQTLI
ncbi:hypothetical protein [Vibrio phage phiKT1028]|nr:hypothetical protein [Vibrio phage phiKT1028]